MSDDPPIIIPGQLSVWDDAALRHQRLADVGEETRAALERVDEHAGADWKQRALDAIHYLCLTQPDFYSDDVWTVGRLDAANNDDRALGPQLLKAKRLGWCEKTDRTRPSVRSNLSGKPVWRSLLWQEP